jgi:hypothetical protein
VTGRNQEQTDENLDRRTAERKAIWMRPLVQTHPPVRILCAAVYPLAVRFRLDLSLSGVLLSRVCHRLGNT